MAPDQNADGSHKIVSEIKPQSFSALWPIIVFAICILVVSVAYDVIDDRTAAIKNEQERLLTQSTVIVNNLESHVRPIPGLLRSFSKGSADPEINRRLTDLAKAIPGFRTFVILDKNGIVTSTNLVSYLQHNFSSREYFSEPRRLQASEKLYVSKPFKSVLNEFVITMSVINSGSDGSFDGVTGATFDPAYFKGLLNSVIYADDMWSSIIHGDGLLFMMSPEKSGTPGTNLNVPGTFYTRHRQSGRSDNVFIGTSYLAGTERIVALRTFDPPGLNLSKPLIVAVSRDLNRVLTGWRQDTVMKCSAVGGLSCLLLIGGWLLHVRMNRLERIRRSALEDQIMAQNGISRAVEIKRSYNRLELMQEVAQHHATCVQELLDFSLEKVLALTDSQLGYIYHYSEETRQFELNTWSRHVMEACRVAEPQSLYQLENTGIWGEVVRQRKPILINDFAADDPLKKGYPDGHVQLSRFLSIPVFDHEQIVAVVGVANKQLPYDQTDVLQLTLMMEGVWKIAARLKLEGQVSRGSQEWQSTFDSINDSISLVDAEQRIIRCNRATSTLLGLDFPEILGQPCWRLFHNAQAPIADCPLSRMMHSRHSETSIISHQDRWLEVTVDPIVSDCGEISGAVHIVRDVTERLKLNESVREVNELFTLFMKYSPIYMFIKEVTDTDSRVLQASDNFVDMIGIPSQEMIGKNMYQLFPKEFADRITADDLQVVASGQVQRSEEFLNDGTYITYKFPIIRADGKNILAGFTIDVTEQKRSEDKVREMQSQLMQNDKLATIGQLAAGVAHEINNPMGFIGSNMATLAKYIEKYNRYIDQLEIELKECSSGDLPEHIQALRQSLKLDYIMRDISVLVDESNEGIDRVKRIVQDLRTFSRADTANVGAADLNSCMDSTINIVINEIKYSAELKREYGDIPKIQCNAQQINQIFMNLLMNAAHAIQAKGDEVGEIVVRTWCDQDNVYVSVSDNGCGIPPEIQSRIFDAFFTTKDVGKGTGLGLSISAGIIHKHGGDISLSSTVGSGSTFVVRLPLQQSNSEHADQEL